MNDLIVRLNRAIGAQLISWGIRSVDHARWGEQDSLLTAWDDRTGLIANMIPSGSRVLEFGAGRMVLASMLSDDCIYFPSDVVDRGRNTLICDLNRQPLPELPEVDFVVFGGVLEYVRDVPTVLKEVAKITSNFVVGYAPYDGRWKSHLLRRRRGWVSSLSRDDLLSIMDKYGFSLVDDKMIRRTIVLHFNKRS